MATTVTVYDLENHPGTSKTVIVDHRQVVPLSAGGDEKWVLSATTTATASGSLSIQPTFIQTFAIGWAKSTGFNQGPYTISASQKNLRVSINGGAYRNIELTTGAIPISGQAVALDMQTKINSLASSGGVEAGNLAYKNAWVTFEDGKFLIMSGSPTANYTGSNKTGVSVDAGLTNDVSVHLGFFAYVNTETIASTSVPETYLLWPYVTSSGWSYLEVADGNAAAMGDCIGVTDGTNIEYRYVSSVAAGIINVNAALDNDYASNSRVQVLRMQDPESKPHTAFDDVDEATRFAIASLVNQIDFS